MPQRNFWALNYARDEESAVKIADLHRYARRNKRSDAAKARIEAKAKAKITLPRFSWDKTEVEV